MCLLIVLSRVVPSYPLVVAANRDERYERPTEPLTVLRSSPPRVLGGRDLRAGGTWLAVNERGVVAGLTNKPTEPGFVATKRSRGEIPLALTRLDTASEAITTFERSWPRQEFNPCWALVGDRTSLWFLDMAGPERVPPVELAPGVHVLENKPLRAPSAKIDHVRQVLGDLGGRSADEVFGRLRQILSDHTVTQAACDDGDQSRRAAQVSACCVHTEEYGTRSSMLIRQACQPSVPPEVWVSEGPSCRAPWTEAAFDRLRSA